MSALCLPSPVTSCVKTQRAATSAPAPEDTACSQMERPAKVNGLGYHSIKTMKSFLMIFLIVRYLSNQHTSSLGSFYYATKWMSKIIIIILYVTNETSLSYHLYKQALWL